MYSYEYPRPAVTVDALVFRVINQSVHILLIQRGHEPFKGMWACPGGFIDMEETPEQAVVRELHEETGLTGIKLFQFHTYGGVHRDPRHRTIAIAYTGLLNDDSSKVQGGDDATDAKWFDIKNLPLLAFDHNLIVDDGIAFAKSKGWFN